MYLIKNGTLVNEGRVFQGNVLVKDDRIEAVLPPHETVNEEGLIVIDASGLHVLPGVIDDQVHFREPGLTHKGDLFSETRAAVAGGVTSVMEMPNTQPQTTTIALLEEKYRLGAAKALTNYSFYMGATNNNLDELLKADPETVCGIKVFMGSSTGNMLVDDLKALEKIFSSCKILIATHCEDEEIIHHNSVMAWDLFGENVPMSQHPVIRSEAACYRSSKLAVDLAKKHQTRLHVLHLSTGLETDLFSNQTPLAQKRITAEVCVHHLWFNDTYYDKLGARIKWNPAIKSESDRLALWQALLDGRLDVVATDHAPHLLDEKNRAYQESPSGGPFIQHSLCAMLEFYHQQVLTLEQVVDKMCHAPAICFGVRDRGYIRKQYKADLCLVNLHQPWTVSEDNLEYKCKWSPLEGITLQSKVAYTFVSGQLAYANGVIHDSVRGQRLTFNR